MKYIQPNPKKNPFLQVVNGSLSKGDLRLIVKLSADSSVSRPEIADKVGCAKSTVFKWQKRLGVI